jgi:two-component sensor histidine kinase
MLANSLHRFYRLPDIIINLDIRVSNVALDIETAVPCGLIINELISNAFKHAFKGRTGKGCISVLFTQTATEYVLTIADDGNGLPEGFSLDTQSSMGTEIVVILTHQLDGKISFSNDNGTRFEITFPKKEKKEEPLVAEA